jgi:membrane protease YdiL (CAAX protease family)
MAQRTKRNIAEAALYVVWFAVAFLTAAFLVAFVLAMLDQFGLVDARQPSTLENVLIQALMYVALLGVAAGVPWLLRKRLKKLKLPKWRELLGLKQRPKWSHAGYAVAGFLAYIVFAQSVLFAARVMLGSEIMDQTQDVGFATANNSLWQLALIFVSLVVVAPLAEELVFRGFLFGRLRRVLSFWPTAILVSLIFATVHGQINVAIDTFVLSMVMSYAREETGSIWPCIGIHMTKNGVAFAILFLY